MNKLIRFIYFSLLTSTLCACGSQSTKITIDYTNVGIVKSKDYIDHLAAAGADYLAFEDTKTIKLRPDTIQFLESIYERLFIT